MLTRHDVLTPRLQIRRAREIAYDRKREVFLKAEGYQIVRVQNDDVYKHINDVLDMILMGLEGRL